ncbi:siderophore-interacting protein [Falsarthrobacter nasiphocae]|uniref:NADPH-dependent ferric siderophore reductase n=1 Tax=Falsarthrobacter nasiphocae TaxID=189863 RepID=A0AAE4C564_9MICC|nr:siderophore-interacting protein [Falsarthrobacter nasiphocae]MDR6892026.1 NADPH-dependent ferric siderophore reductase [Falsarthrobacter nasiphocae]
MAVRLERLVMKAMGSKQTTLRVLAAEAVTPGFRRVHVNCGPLLAEEGIHPTMWLRLWFDDGGRPHQRAFTLVDPDPASGNAWLEFALHEGIASDWARAAAPGQTIEASLLGSRYDWDGEGPAEGTPWERTLVVGDMAALPAINSLLDHLGDAPADIVLEQAREDDADVPVRLRPSHSLVRCSPGGPRVEEEVARLVRPQGQRVWVALEAARTRALVKALRHEHGVPKTAVSALGYWKGA